MFLMYNLQNGIQFETIPTSSSENGEFKHSDYTCIYIAVLLHSHVFDCDVMWVPWEGGVGDDCDNNLIQSSAVITRFNIVRYYIADYRNWSRISIRCWNHKRRASYGVYFVNICEKPNRVITAPHCICILRRQWIMNTGIYGYETENNILWLNFHNAFHSVFLIILLLDHKVFEYALCDFKTKPLSSHCLRKIGYPLRGSCPHGQKSFLLALVFVRKQMVAVPFPGKPHDSLIYNVIKRFVTYMLYIMTSHSTQCPCDLSKKMQHLPNCLGEKSWTEFVREVY